MKGIYFILIGAVLFASCRKEVVEVQKVDQAFSAVYTIRPADWYSSDGGKSYSADLEIPELDNVIYQDGAVLVFLSFEGETYYEAIPQVFDGITYGVIHSNGYVVIDISAISGETINPPGKNVTAKVILIDAARLALRRDVNLRDIQSVQSAFNIK
ncbi:MAG: hypothetical protein KIT80_05575 [Chitinophagaceae bacterium]|nr:hypothetical protein [Chitinophagaceae bacterium]MCW5926366.1 hypothetical protein [Chitinophagaceae bacterium]